MPAGPSSAVTLPLPLPPPCRLQQGRQTRFSKHAILLLPHILDRLYHLLHPQRASAGAADPILKAYGCAMLSLCTKMSHQSPSLMQASAGAADPVLEAYDARLAEASGAAQQAQQAAPAAAAADMEADPFGLDALLEQQAAAEAAAAARKRQVSSEEVGRSAQQSVSLGCCFPRSIPYVFVLVPHCRLPSQAHGAAARWWCMDCSSRAD